MWQYLGLLIGVVGILYAPSLNNGFLFEDQTVLQSFSEKGLKAGGREAVLAVSPEGYWRPVSRLSLQVQKGTGALPAPFPFRAVNGVLVVLVAVAAFGLMRQPALGIRRLAACLAALLLVVHPVASAGMYRLVDGRDLLLALLFGLGSVALYLRGTGWGVAGATVCCALALGSSEQALWIPLVLLAAEAVGLPGRDGNEQEFNQGPAHLTVVARPVRKFFSWLRMLPVLVVVVLYLVVRHGVLGGLQLDDAAEGRMPFFEWVYAWQVLAAPGREAVFQPPLSIWLAGWRFMAGAGLLGLIAVAAFLALRHSEATFPERKGLEVRRVAFWGAWLIATRLAVMGWLAPGPLFDEGQELAFSVAVWGVLAWSISRFWSLEWVRREGVVFAACVVLVLAAISMGRRVHCRDDETFTSHWARVNPEAWHGYARRAEIWQAGGRMEAADRQVKRGLMLQPDAPELLRCQASIQEKSGRLDEALVTFQKMAALNPTNWAIREKEADLTFTLGRFQEARDLFLALADALPEKVEIKTKLEAARKAELGASP